MLNADMSTRTSRIFLLMIFALSVFIGGCDTGHRFGAGFGDPPVTAPPDPPEPPDCISPSLNNVAPDPVQGTGGSTLTLEGVKSRYLQRSVIAVDANGEQVAREDAELLGCRTVDALLDIAKKAFS